MSIDESLDSYQILNWFFIRPTSSYVNEPIIYSIIVQKYLNTYQKNQTS